GRGVGDVADGDLLEEILRVASPRRSELRQLLGVVGRAGDRLLEDRRVRGHPPKPVLGDQPVELARPDQAAPQVVVPDALPQLDEAEERVLLRDGDHQRATFPCAASCSRQAATTRSGVNPNLRWTSLSGAEAPKVCIPIIVPSEPMKRSQPSVEACSTPTRAVMSGGRTCSRYSRGSRSKSSQDGMLTTRTFSPSAL